MRSSTKSVGRPSRGMIAQARAMGVKATSLVMGKHSGRHAFVHKLEELGYKLGSNQLEDAFTRFKALAGHADEVGRASCRERV